MHVWVDLELEAAIPDHDDVSGLADRLDDPAVPHDELGRAVPDADELDASSNADACTNTCSEQTGAVRIHVWSIGTRSRRLDDHRRRQDRVAARRNANSRRARPNSTA